MLGERSNWVRTAGTASQDSRDGQARRCRLIEVPVSERGPILRRYQDRSGTASQDIGGTGRGRLPSPGFPVFRVVPGNGPAIKEGSS